MRERDKSNLIQGLTKKVERLEKENNKLKEENDLLKRRLELWEPPRDGDSSKAWGC
jgi:regulator of replication initiation timing